MRTILSLGMGVESITILVRWIMEPATCPCPLNQLVVITAMTGDEYDDTKVLTETFILPLLRKHSIRFVQVARHGHLEADGITILSDTNMPDRLYIEGDYRLSDELRLAGTVPQFGGEHICSLKFKAFVIETWLKTHFLETFVAEERASNSASLHAFGYNADETSRVTKCLAADAKRMAFGFNADEEKRVSRAKEYDTPSRQSIFPLVEWGWARERCIEYLMQQFGVIWPKSACVYCPFNKMDAEAIERHKAHPQLVADALMLEHVSLSLNPRGTLYRDKSLVQITIASGNNAAMDSFNQKLDAFPWALYRVRRVYQAKKGEDGLLQETKKGQAIRAVEKLATFDRAADARAKLALLAGEMGIEQESKGIISYVYVQRRGETYPAKEEFYVAAPAVVESKTRYGIAWFEEKWSAAQGNLFSCAD